MSETRKTMLVVVVGVVALLIVVAVAVVVQPGQGPDYDALAVMPEQPREETIFMLGLLYDRVDVLNVETQSPNSWCVEFESHHEGVQRWLFMWRGEIAADTSGC